METHNNLGLLALLPVELFANICDFLDTIITLKNFTSTCYYIHNLDILYNRVIISGDRADNLFIIKHIDIVPHVKILSKITKLNNYFDVCKFQYQYRKKLLPLLSISGFYTDIESKLFSSIKFFYTSNDNFLKAISYSTNDYGNYRQVIFLDEIITKNIILVNNFTYWKFNIYAGSEIITGRHRIYTDNNITINYSTQHIWAINDVDNFITFYF